MRILPHIVFDKKIDLFDFSQKFAPIFERTSTLIKISSIFVEKNGLTALLPTIVIDQIHQEFLIEISTRKSKTTIRLYHTTDPEKTNGVKHSMILLCRFILSNYPDLKITQTNIDQHLDMIISN